MPRQPYGKARLHMQAMLRPCCCRENGSCLQTPLAYAMAIAPVSEVQACEPERLSSMRQQSHHSTIVGNHMHFECHLSRHLAWACSVRVVQPLGQILSAGHVDGRQHVIWRGNTGSGQHVLFIIRKQLLEILDDSAIALSSLQAAD